MNQKELMEARRNNLRKLDIAYRSKINAVEVNINNTFWHELSKFLCVWFLKRGVCPELLQTNIDYYISKLERKYVSNSELQTTEKWKCPQVITEARLKDKSRWDIMVLDTGQRVEIVDTCDKSVVPYDGDTIVVKI